MGGSATRLILHCTRAAHAANTENQGRGAPAQEAPAGGAQQGCRIRASESKRRREKKGENNEPHEPNNRHLRLSSSSAAASQIVMPLCIRLPLPPLRRKAGGRMIAARGKGGARGTTAGARAATCAAAAGRKGAGHC